MSAPRSTRSPFARVSAFLSELSRDLEAGPRPGSRHTTSRAEAYAIGLGSQPRNRR